MTFDKISTQSLAQFFSQHQKKLHLAVVVLLSLYLIAFAARLVWRIIPEPTAPATPLAVVSGPVNAAQAAQGGVNVSRLQELDLFGSLDPQQAAVVEAPQVTDAPETKLNLTLFGVVTSSNNDEAAAIIANRGTQTVYGLGEKIDGTNATLDQVMPDRVIIKNAGRHETLMLDGVDYEANARKNAAVTEIAQGPQRALPPSGRNIRPGNEPQPAPRELDESASAIRDEPSSFTDFIAISPRTNEGALVGYEIRPGKKPELFKSAGLQPGDVVIQINGLDLTDTQQSMEAMNELRQADTIELTLLRDEEYVTLYLDLPEPGEE